MGMTRREFIAKNEIRKILSKEGYPTYSYLISDSDIHLTKDPDVIGYMIPGKGVITINEGLYLEQVSVVVRHEILHEYLRHAQRFEKLIGKDAYAHQSANQHQMMNIAGDYEISNRGYTDRDKIDIRNLYLNGQRLRGLVTEDDHPNWVNMTAEEMYNELRKQIRDEQEDMKKKIKVNRKTNSAEYVSAYNDIINSLDSDDVSDNDLNDILNSLKED